MPLTRRRYCDMPAPKRTPGQSIAFRLRRLSAAVQEFALYPPWRRHPEDTGSGFTVHRAWGHWTVRPGGGWRSWRWITPPIHATRTIPGNDQDSAWDWAGVKLGIYTPEGITGG